MCAKRLLDSQSPNRGYWDLVLNVQSGAKQISERLGDVVLLWYTAT